MLETIWLNDIAAELTLPLHHTALNDTAMTPPDLAELIKNVDPVDALRLLVADLQLLADRLGVKEHSRTLQQTLKSTQERVFGPHAVVMLLGEEAALKRRCMERLLGSGLPQVPEALLACTRLEYGAEAECTVTMPQGLTAVLPLDQLQDFLERHSAGMPRQATQAIRLPNAVLARGLAIIDTPALTGDSPTPCVLDSAHHSDAWVFVLGAGQVLSEASQALIRQLPEHAARLEILIEGAETLSGEARLTAREQLITTLREQCGIPEPRLTLVASAAAEGEENSFWHGRFATFHSVMVLRGRERWLEATHAVVADALEEMGQEIEFELRSQGLGLRHARLRMGLKELDGLRVRLAELGRLNRERPRETPASLQTGDRAADLEDDLPESSLTQKDDADHASGIPPEPMGEPTFVQFSGDAPFPGDGPNHRESVGEQGADEQNPGVPRSGFSSPSNLSNPSRTRRGISVTLSEDVARLLRSRPRPGDAPGSDPESVTLPWRIAGLTLVGALLCLVAWVVWPRIHLPGRQPPAPWSYQPAPKSADDQPSAEAATPAANRPDAGLPPPVKADAGPESTAAEALPNDPATPNPTVPGRNARFTLSRPATLKPRDHRPRKRRHGFLGLGRVWQWIRHPAGGNDQTEGDR